MTALETGEISTGLDLEASNEDGSLYKSHNCFFHELTHLPKSKHCPVCTRAKMLFVPARKIANQSEQRQDDQMRFRAKNPFDLLFMDLKIVKKGGRGKLHEASFNVLDAFTGATRTYRLTKHDQTAIRSCLLHFCGRQACNYIIRGHSDNAGEILKACDELGWISEPTAENRPVHNPFAERNIQTVTMGARCALAQSGLPVERFWADAEAHFTTALFFFTPSKCNPEETKSEALIGLSYEGHAVPFGALVFYKPDPKKLPHTHSPLSKPGLFLGWQIGVGQRWNKIYKVLDYELAKKMIFQVQTIREVIPHRDESQKFVFPVANAEKKAGLPSHASRYA